jgi:hypothetical protein
MVDYFSIPRHLSRMIFHSGIRRVIVWQMPKSDEAVLPSRVNDRPPYQLSVAGVLERPEEEERPP